MNALTVAVWIMAGLFGWLHGRSIKRARDAARRDRGTAAVVVELFDAASNFAMILLLVAAAVMLP